ncbi:MAG: dicarboxylate/amino acid:cation symporter [Vampirovibrionales bacterium]|nr:dicarboxylate/amino acid:cation symporter [Vampirovibrionales bacterium]
MRLLWLILVALGLGTKRHWHILFAIVLGIVLGILGGGEQFAPLHAFFELIGKLFIRLISMLVIPLIISSIVVGVCSIGDGRQLGRTGGKTIGWFIALMLIASGIAVGLSLFFRPGMFVQAQLFDELPKLAEALSQTLANPPTLSELVLNFIPKNPIESLANMDLVPVIFFTMLLSFAIASTGDAGRPLVVFFEALFTATMKLTDWVMVLSVPGIFSLTFITVAKSGLRIFQELAPYMLVLLIGLLLQMLVVFPLLLKLFARVNAFQLYRAIAEALMVGFGTASSSATLPVTIACCERRAGISNRIASFVLPTGITINKTGTTMFEVIAVLFLAQAYGIQLDIFQMVLIALFAIVASIGAPGVPSAGLITIAIVINSIGVELNPLFTGVALLWPIDRLLDMSRTVINVASTCTVATLVAASEGELNRDVLADKAAWGDVIGQT